MVESEDEEERILRPKIQRSLARISKETADIPISQVMRKGVIVIDKKEKVSDAAKIMKRNKIGSLIVMEKEKAVGIVTERDIVRKLVAEKKPLSTTVSKIMSTPIRVIEERMSIRDAISLMKQYGIKRLPVIDAQKRLVGIVTDTDITRAVPGMIDLISDLSNIERFEATTESVGICNKCGLYSDTLLNVGGEFLCEECREEEESI